MSGSERLSQAQRWNGETGQRWLAQRERHAGVRERLTPHLLRAAAIAPGDRALDVGCGCGEPTLLAARAAGSDGTVLALDLSGPILAAARHAAAIVNATNIEFRQGDAQTYPLPPSGFDVVISSFGVMFFDDPAAAFGNLRAGLRPGGRLAFLCWQDERHNELFGLPLRAFDRLAGPCPPGGDDLFTDPGRITALLAGAEFTDIRVDAVAEPARFGSDVDDVMAHVRETTRVRELLDRLPDPETTDRVLATMAEQFAVRARPDGVWVTAAAWLVTARRPISDVSDDCPSR